MSAGSAPRFVLAALFSVALSTDATVPVLLPKGVRRCVLMAARAVRLSRLDMHSVPNLVMHVLGRSPPLEVAGQVVGAHPVQVPTMLAGLSLSRECCDYERVHRPNLTLPVFRERHLKPAAHIGHLANDPPPHSAGSAVAPLNGAIERPHPPMTANFIRTFTPEYRTPLFDRHDSSSGKIREGQMMHVPSGRRRCDPDPQSGRAADIVSGNDRIRAA